MLINTFAFDSCLGVNRRASEPCASAMRAIRRACDEAYDIWLEHACNLKDNFVPFGPQDDILARVILVDYPEVFEY